MQIVILTPDRLVLRARHSVLAGVAWLCAMLLGYGMFNIREELAAAEAVAMGMTAAGFAALSVYCLRPAVWAFDRTSNLFEWTLPGLFSSRHGFAPLDSIARVRIDTSWNDRAETYRVVAETPGSTIPFERMYSAGDRADYQRTVDTIRAWLRG